MPDPPKFRSREEYDAWKAAKAVPEAPSTTPTPSASEPRCESCHGPRARNALVCPHCGHRRHRIGAALLVAFGLVAAFMLFSIWVVGGLQGAREQIGREVGVDLSETAERHRRVRLHVRVEESSYEHGYLKVVGIIENVGPEAAERPRLRLRVYRGETLLADDAVWPAGTRLEALAPGASVAFEGLARIPGEPGSVKYSVSVDRYAFEVSYPK